ncbi:MAG: hypothetical protein DMG60_13110 [Acidobacteria bacterium]|nr:MAG: hypothetical protein DMG60_13110 [Acidobacteriota bacterium]
MPLQNHFRKANLEKLAACCVSTRIWPSIVAQPSSAVALLKASQMKVPVNTKIFNASRLEGY